MNNNNINNNNQPEDQQQFIFSQNTTNKVTPKAIKVLPEFDEMLCSKDINLDLLMENLSKENFDKNELFNMDNDEKKLIKSYQFLFQYFKYSITSLQQQCQLVENLSNQQSQYNMKADELIHRQTGKITALDCRNKDLNDNMLGMEFLIKSLNIDTDISDINAKARINDIKVKDDDDDEKNNIQEYKSNYDIGNNKIEGKDRVYEKNIFRRTLEEGNKNIVDVEKSSINNNPDYYSGSFGEFSGNGDRNYFNNVISNNNNNASNNYEYEDPQDKNKEAYNNNEINNHDNQYTLNNDVNKNNVNDINSNHINTNITNNSNHIKNSNYNSIDKNTLESNRDRNLNIKSNTNNDSKDKNLISNNKFSNYNTEENVRTPDISIPNKETTNNEDDHKDNDKEAIRNNSYNSNNNDQIKENIEASYGEFDTVDKENEIIEISDIKGTQSQHKYSSLNKPSSSIENVKTSNNNAAYNKNSLMLSDDYGDYGEFDN